MRSAPPKRATAYALALLASLLAFVLTHLLQPWMALSPFLFFAVAVLLSVWLGGVGPGLLALGVTAVGGVLFFNTAPVPVHTAALPAIRIIAYCGVLGSLIWLVNAHLQSHRQAEEALRRLRASEEQYRRLLETANEGIWVLDAEGRTSYLNPRMAEMLGCGVDGLRGRPFSEFLWEADAPEMEARWARCRQGEAQRYELRLRRPDGAELFTSASTTPIFDVEEQYVGILGMITDVSERRKLEEDLRQSQKMEAIGRLAGGIAHDFNNMLGVMLGYTDLLQMQANSADPTTPVLAEIRKAGERAASLTRQLLAFSRKQPMAFQVLNLNEVVSGMEGLLLPLLGRDVRLVIRTDPELGCVEADRGQVEQIVLNLAVNARDAMPGGGSLVLETRNVVRSNGAGLAPYVLLVVEDTGCGMDAQTRSQIFEPFFTTKEKGKGTGLGLATVYGVVQQSRGLIEVESAPGKGSRFLVYLPQTQQAAAEKAAPVPVEPARSAAATILVVDDEPMVRDLACTMLKAEGFTVISARDGEDALRLLRDYPHSIHLLLTDVVMPGMGGQELGERVKAARPEVRVLLMSGYAERVEGTQFLRGGPLVEKPFTQQVLCEGIRRVLAG